jgi:hypothetical protein
MQNLCETNCDTFLSSFMTKYILPLEEGIELCGLVLLWKRYRAKVASVIGLFSFFNFL